MNLSARFWTIDQLDLEKLDRIAWRCQLWCQHEPKTRVVAGVASEDAPCRMFTRELRYSRFDERRTDAFFLMRRQHRDGSQCKPVARRIRSCGARKRDMSHNLALQFGHERQVESGRRTKRVDQLRLISRGVRHMLKCGGCNLADGQNVIVDFRSDV